MAKKQSLTDGNQKLIFSEVTCAIEMGAKGLHFEMWHRQKPNNVVLAIWRNEVGPAHSSLTKAPA